MTAEKYYTGHRSRLRDRFLQGGPTALADYEMLELILFAAYPRGDVKPMAKMLLKEFKTFSGVIHASANDLLRIKGIGPAAITALKTIKASAELLLREVASQKPLIATLYQVLDYCKLTMEKLRHEQLRILFLDKKNQLITDEIQQEGTIDHAPVYIREIIKRALDLGASGMIIVHNHPTGDPTPSQADITVTREIQEAGMKLGIQILDHIIIGLDTHVSFRATGLL